MQICEFSATSLPFIKCSPLSVSEHTFASFSRPNLRISLFTLSTAARLIIKSLSPSAIANLPITSLVAAFSPNSPRTPHALNQTSSSSSSSELTNRLMTSLVATFSPNLPRAQHALDRTFQAESPNEMTNPLMTSLVAVFSPNLPRAQHALDRAFKSLSPNETTNRLMISFAAAFSPKLPRASHDLDRTSLWCFLFQTEFWKSSPRTLDTPDNPPPVFRKSEANFWDTSLQNELLVRRVFTFFTIKGQ